MTCIHPSHAHKSLGTSSSLPQRCSPHAIVSLRAKLPPTRAAPATQPRGKSKWTWGAKHFKTC